MAKPPSGYPAESGATCGSSWNRPFIVTGKLPGKSFGAQFTKELPPVSPDLKGGKDFLGWNGAYEAQRREQLLNKMEEVLAQLDAAQTILTSQQAASIRWLIDHALAELDEAQQIHEAWASRTFGPFPLYLPDLPQAFHAECVGKFGQWVTVANPQRPFDFGGGPNRVLCPTKRELELRQQARRRIRQRFVDAAHHIRCAEFGIWRLMLYDEALREWSETPAGRAVTGFTAATPAPEPPKFRLGTIIELPPPANPPGFESLPTPPPLPPDPAGIPAPGLVAPSAPKGSTRRRTAVRDASVVAIAGVALWLLPKVLLKA